METEAGTRREIDLHRRVCVITPETIDIRPARSLAVVPLLGLLLAAGMFVAVLFLIETLPFFLVLLLMAGAIIVGPFSGMGLVFSIYGANVVFNRDKRTALWQQGLFGMGVGTEELVPFEKMERLEVEEVVSAEQPRVTQEFAQYEIKLLKTSGRRLSLGQVTAPRDYADVGLTRAREVAEAVADMTGKPVQLIGPAGAGRRRRRRRRRSASNVA